jgi:acyl-CoA dehydrogenase
MTARELPDEMALLGQTCQELFTEAGGIARVRKLRDSGARHRFSAELWAHIAELGWLGIQAPEAHSGVGGGADFDGGAHVDGVAGGCRALLPVLEAVGAALAPEPVRSATLAVRLLSLVGSEAQRERWLGPIVAGTEIPVVVGALERRTRVGAADLRLVTGPGGAVLTGHSPYVLDGTLATVLLVLIDAPAPKLLVVPRATPGVRVTDRLLMDLRNWGSVAFEDVPAPGGGRTADAVLVDRVLDEATVGLAAEMLGSMWAVFDRTLEHVKTRVQFGRPIGSFQALQHRLARLYTDLLLTDACVRDAAGALDEGRPDARALASAAKVRCVASSRWVCREGIQLHGGLGVTDECDIGLYVKNLRVAEFVLGDERWHTDRWASLGGY